MIQATGTITMGDGVTSFINPLINVAFATPIKGQPNIVTAQVCRVVNSKVYLANNSQILQHNFEMANPDFASAQNSLLTALRVAYPQVTFEIVE